MIDNNSDTFIIRDMETLRVVADAMRSQIMELLVQSPQTVRQVAEKLGDSPNKLYYHFNLLEKHGLIEVSETRMVTNMMEKVYKASARHIDCEPSLVTFSTEEGKNAVKTYITPIIDTTREDLLRSLQARDYQLEHGASENPRRMLVFRQVCHIPDDRILEFSKRLEDMYNEFLGAGDNAPTPTSPNYAMMIAFYPSYYFEAVKSEKPSETDNTK